LVLTNPVMAAAGLAGYGQPGPNLVDLAQFGAVITGPITLRPQRGPAPPRVAEVPGGFILNTGGQNPGVKKVLQLYSLYWPRLGVPVIAHLPAQEPDDLRRTAAALAGNSTLAAFELGIPAEAWPEEVARWIGAIRQAAILPLLAKLPLTGPLDLVEAAAQADALVLGAPPLGAAALPGSESIVTGPLYGPVLHPLALARLQQVRAIVDMPLIAAGGIHTKADAAIFLQAGAAAVQLDVVLWVDPLTAMEILSF
jgi:dihydroorotate dehydrogenase